MKKLIKDNPIQLLFIAVAAVVLAISVYANLLMVTSSQMVAEETEQRLLALSKAAAQLATAEELNQLATPEDMNTPLYGDIKQRLLDFAEDSDILFAYYMREADGMFQFIVDSDYTEETVGLDTEPVDHEPAPLAAWSGTPAVAGVGNYSVNWPGVLAAYAPVYDENNQVVAIAGVDMSDAHIVASKSNTILLAWLLVLALCLVIAIGFIGVSVFKRKASLAESANEAKSQFLSRMSHEIRTPMNAIVGLSRMARETEDMQKIHHYLDNIDTASGHLRNLVDDILDISKIESGKMIQDEDAVDTRREIESIAKLVEPQMAAKAQRFVLSIDEGVPPYLYSDSTHLRQVVVNLLSNAIKFTPEGGQITLRASVGDHREDRWNILWQVQDTGIGIDQQYMHKLFQPFEQGDGSTTRKYGGTGLGLAIAKQLVEMMGGNIRVESTPGEGSLFIFDTWHREAPESLVKRPEIPEENGGLDLTGKHVLVVEDSNINQMIAGDLLESFGAEVSYADNGQEGVDAFLRNPGKFNYIFMDIQMPVMDGYQATHMIRNSTAANAKTVPIIAMTANVFREDVERAQNAGMDAHVGKPFDVDHVRAAIRSVS